MGIANTLSNSFYYNTNPGFLLLYIPPHVEGGFFILTQIKHSIAIVNFKSGYMAFF
jgi:hypothetical protein